MIAPLYINEPELIDKSLELCMAIGKSEKQKYNIRVYIPLDISKDAILRRLDRVIMQSGANSCEQVSDRGKLAIKYAG